jgi:3D (Asp-Asp-Asp) domain-containing protein
VAGRHRPTRLAAAAGALAVLTLGAADVDADTIRGLRDRASTLSREEHGALVQLYAAESAAARARTELAHVEAHAARLEDELASAARRRTVLRGSLNASRDRVAAMLRRLYIAGPARQPLAVVMGAASFDEAVDTIDGLRRAAHVNALLADEAGERARLLRRATVRLREQAGSLEAARAEAASLVARLEEAARRRAGVVAELRRETRATAARIVELETAARTAQRRSERITARTAPPPPARGDAAEEPMPAEPDVVRQVSPGQLTVRAVAYVLRGRTASGLPTGPGIIAVDPAVIPLGTRVFVPGYGEAVAADTGSAIKGMIIDLWMPSLAAARAWGSRTVTITVYRS